MVRQAADISERVTQNTGTLASGQGGFFGTTAAAVKEEVA
jgi:hypothetical protein